MFSIEEPKSENCYDIHCQKTYFVLYLRKKNRKLYGTLFNVGKLFEQSEYFSAADPKFVLPSYRGRLFKLFGPGF